jgi:hypothetical protein
VLLLLLSDDNCSNKCQVRYFIDRFLSFHYFVRVCFVDRLLSGLFGVKSLGTNGNSLIHFEAIDASLEYLGEPGVTEAGRDILV